MINQEPQHHDEGESLRRQDDTQPFNPKDGLVVNNKHTEFLFQSMGWLRKDQHISDATPEQIAHAGSTFDIRFEPQTSPDSPRRIKEIQIPWEPLQVVFSSLVNEQSPEIMEGLIEMLAQELKQKNITDSIDILNKVLARPDLMSNDSMLDKLRSRTNVFTQRFPQLQGVVPLFKILLEGTKNMNLRPDLVSDMNNGAVNMANEFQAANDFLDDSGRVAQIEQIIEEKFPGEPQHQLSSLRENK